MVKQLLFGGCVLFALVASASAQYYGDGMYYHSSTAEEGIARGMADLVRSAGAANLSNSEAAKNWEDARAKNFDNRIKGTATYFDLKRMNRESRAEYEREAPSSEQIFRINRARTPNRLSASELDPVTGAIAWPSALRGAAFDEQRSKVERVFAHRVESSGALSIDDYTAVQTCLEQMHSTLQGQIKDVPTSLYTRGSSFLKSLMLEARLAAG